MAYLLQELATHVSAELIGDADCEISKLNTLQLAQKGDIAFLANRRYTPQLANTQASAVILNKANKDKANTNCLITDDPYLAFAKIARLLHPAKEKNIGIHASAVIGDNCQIDATACIAANVFIGNGVSIGANAYIGPNCVLEDNVSVGRESELVANITICSETEIYNRVRIHPGVVIGAQGFGMAKENGVWLNIPQVGKVIIHDDVDVGANSSIDRGAIDDTIIEKGVKIDNQVQIGHNCIIGEHTAIAGCVGIAGSATIGKRCMIGGAVGIGGHLSIADDTIITGMSMVPNSIKESGMYSSGIPVVENKKWRKNVIRYLNIENIFERIKKIEQK